MKRVRITILSFILLVASDGRAEPLGQGDMAIIGFSSTNLVFVALNSLGPTQDVLITDFNKQTVNLANNISVQWKAPTNGLSAGSVVNIAGTPFVFTNVGGTFTTLLASASFGQATNLIFGFPWRFTNHAVTVFKVFGPEFIHMVALDGTTLNGGLFIDVALVSGLTYVDLGLPVSAATYLGPRSGEPTFSNYLAAIGNHANWVKIPTNLPPVIGIDLTSFTLSASASTPERIHYQGRLTDGTNIFSGTADIGIGLFDQATGGSLYYTETQSVVVVDGLYDLSIGASNTMPGALASVFTNEMVFLEVVINGQALSPRERIESVGYAFRAERVSRRSVDAEALAFGAVTAPSIAENAITGGKILDGSISASDLGSSSVGTTQLQPSSVNASIIAANAINSLHLQNGGVSNIDLAASSVDSSKVLDGSLTGADIADGTISNIDLAVSSVTSATILDGTIATIDIEDGAVTLSKINASADLLTRSEGDGRYINVTNDNLSTTVNGSAAAPAHSFLSDPDTGMYRVSADTLGFSTAGSQRMHVASSGLIGIGTPNPSGELHVRREPSGSGINFSPVLVLENNTNVFASLVGPTNATMAIFFQTAVSVFPDASIRYNGLGRREIIFRTLNADRLMIASNGFVGINTTSPTNRLHVVGTVQATAYITSSDRDAKENIQPVSPEDVLAKVTSLPISTWTFKDEPNGTHIGPMAQDFHAAFGFGNTDAGIMTVDADGVALAAIQALAAENARLREELEAIKRKLGL